LNCGLSTDFSIQL